MTADILQPIRRTADLVTPAIRYFSRCYDRHLQRRTLAELDDRALADIGLTRRDVERECATTFWRGECAKPFWR